MKQFSLNSLGLFYLMSRILPGMVFVLVIPLVLPVETSIYTNFALLVVSGLAFGQLLNSLALIVEDSIGLLDSHRHHFYDELHQTIKPDDENGSREIDPLGKVPQELSELPIGESDSEEPSRISLYELFSGQFKEVFSISVRNLEKETAYTLTRTFVEVNGTGRSPQYQALQSFSRNMWTTLLFLLLVTFAGWIAVESSILTYEPLISKFSTAEISIFVAALLACTLLSFWADRKYTRYYVTYLISDFCVMSLYKIEAADETVPPIPF